MSSQISLCLACSASLLPKQSQDVFTTQCCNRPICPSCLKSNPRLARYNPCLSCLGGVAVVGHSSSQTYPAKLGHVSNATNGDMRMNINGGVDDEDVFSIGDDEDDEDIAGSQLNGAAVNPGRRTPPPAYEEFAHGETPGLTSSGGSDHRNDPPATRQSAEPSVHDWDNASSETVEVGTTFSPSPTPQKYHIRPQDTLQGIALRFGLNARALCKLNNLPPSTLSTTPHLLHTRTVLTLPPSAASSSQPQTPPGQPSEEYERRRALERASKRLQTLTKETDWRVAKAYAALADDPDAEAAFEAKLKELMLSSQGGGESSLEARAVDQYLDDLEWEATEIREGRGVRIEGLRASSSKTAKG